MASSPRRGRQKVASGERRAKARRAATGRAAQKLRALKGRGDSKAEGERKKAEARLMTALRLFFMLSLAPLQGADVNLHDPMASHIRSRSRACHWLPSHRPSRGERVTRQVILESCVNSLTDFMLSTSNSRLGLSQEYGAPLLRSVSSPAAALCSPAVNLIRQSSLC